MNVIEQNTFHSEKSAPQNKYKGYGTGQDETLIKNQSTDGKINFGSKKGLSEVVRAFSGFNKVIGMTLFMLFSLTSYSQGVQITCPSQANLFGCSEDNINFGGTLGSYSSVPKSITEAEFITLGGAINPGIPPYDISYQDIISAGPCPMTIVTRTFNITDAAGTMDECQQLITVEDNIPPTIDCPMDMQIQLGSGECEKQVFYSPIDGDDCSGNPTITQISGPPSGSILDKNLSPYTITYKAEDECGNMNFCSFYIYLNENEAGDIACEDQINIILNENCEFYFTADYMLKGGDYQCYDDYETFVMFDIDGPLIPTSPIITNDYIGQLLVGKVCDPDGDCCWGYILVEDKSPPEICCVDFSISCTADTDPDFISGITKTYDFPGLPVLIPGISDIDDDFNIVEIELEIDECDTMEILDFNVYLNLSHGQIGDLSAEIEHPDGTIVPLFYRPTISPASPLGCPAGIIDVIFDDEASNPYALFELACPNLAGRYVPISPTLSDFDGKNAFEPGIYKIRIEDHNFSNPSVSGQILGASIEIEADYAHPVAYDNCDSTLDPTYTDVISDTNCDNDCYQIITRTWCVTDSSGNEYCCDQIICLTRPDLEDLVCPPNYDDNCFDPDLVSSDLCTTIYDPVCGCNGVEYSNACEAGNAGIRSWTPGLCPTTTIPGNPLESPWLRDLLANCDHCGDIVSTCNYLGQSVIEVAADPAFCIDPFATVYDYAGNIIFFYGGVAQVNVALALDLQNCNVIFTCGDPLPPISLPVLSCTDDYPKDVNGHPDPSHTGRPQLEDIDIDGFCMFYCTYSDDSIGVCEGSYIIVREWTCYDWCEGTDTTCTQIIKIMDNDPPDVICPDDISLGADGNCVASTTLPPPDVTDGCSQTGTGYTVFVIGDGDLTQSNGNWLLSDIPIGTTTVCYAAFDGCGNRDTCYFDVIVSDVIAPVAKCKPQRKISISDNPSYCSATLFDDGSYDDCSSVTFMVKRFTNPNCTAPDGQESDFGPKVFFYCCDVGDTIAVELKVTDAAGNMNFCTSYMIVEDNLAPTHSNCPADISVSCDVDIDDINNTGGEPDFSDNCGIDTIILTNDSMLVNCGLGMVFRKWVAIDIFGNRDSCEQQITLINTDPFDGDTDVDWPDDTTISCEADTHPDSLPVGSQRPIPDTNGACENVTVSDPIDVIEDAISSDYCYQIRRTWTVTDSCFMDAGGNIVPKDYFHDQIIKITDDEAPTYDCPSDITVDVGDDIVLVVTNIGDNCADSLDITVTYDIDQDYDGVTFVPDITNQSGPNAIGVAGDANYPAPDCAEGDRIHRVRFILEDDCSQSDTCYVNVTVTGEFTCDNVKVDPIEINVGASSGDTKLIANNALTNSFIYNCDPPDGIKLSFDGIDPGTVDLSFNCANIINNEPTLITVYFHLPNGEICERSVNIIDNTSPVLSCTQSLTIPTNGAPGPVTLELFQDLLISELGDNCTSNTDDLIIVYDPPTLPCGAIDEIVTITVKDMFNHVGTANDGNPIDCEISVTIDCSTPPTFNISGGIENEEGDEVEYVAVEVAGDINDIAMTGDDGAFDFNLPSNSNYSITPERDDNILNGVSTYDLVLMSKHILQIEMLSSAYKIIAADVNSSGSVSTIDLVSLRKVILFIDDEFPNNSSWRFVDAEFVFPVPTNPFSTSFPEVYTINGLTEDEVADFVGVKVGDVNASASPNDLIGSSDDRNAESELIFTLEDQSLKAGETYQFDFEATDFDQVEGFQFTMNFNADVIEFNEVEAGDLDNISDANFGLHKLNEGIITASWNANNTAQSLENGLILFSFSFTALEDGQLSDLISINSRFTKAEAYDQNGLLDLSLQFVDESGIVAAERFELFQNQPNPFKDETVIGFYLPKGGKATFKIFDISGREIKSVEGDYSKGYNEISINRSELQSSGVLYYQLESTEHIASKKMVLID